MAKFESGRDIVLIVPSVAKVVLLGVVGVPAVIVTWELGRGLVLLFVNVWHCEGQFSGWIGASKEHVHDG